MKEDIYLHFARSSGSRVTMLHAEVCNWFYIRKHAVKWAAFFAEMIAGASVDVWSCYPVLLCICIYVLLQPDYSRSWWPLDCVPGLVLPLASYWPPGPPGGTHLDTKYCFTQNIQDLIELLWAAMELLETSTNQKSPSHFPAGPRQKYTVVAANLSLDMIEKDHSCVVQIVHS